MLAREYQINAAGERSKPAASFNATGLETLRDFTRRSPFSSSPSWTNISPPDNIPFNVVAVDPTHPTWIYAGSDAGLWFSGDAGATWRKGIDVGIPNVPVYDIQFNSSMKRTVVFTYGRGAFMLTR